MNDVGRQCGRSEGGQPDIWVRFFVHSQDLFVGLSLILTIFLYLFHLIRRSDITQKLQLQIED
jgi:hypothetical protein